MLFERKTEARIRWHYYVVIGGSRVIGGAATQHLVEAGHDILAVSRTPAQAGKWVKADVGTDAGLFAVKEAVALHLDSKSTHRGLDGLLFLGGVWENGAFTDAYDFLASPPEETRLLLSVNLMAPILLAQTLAPALAQADNPRVILNGAMSGLPNAATREVANTATKFGMQGITEALNIALRRHGIGVTVVNFENVATPEVFNDIEQGLFGAQVPIPMADVLATHDYPLNLSADTIPQSIELRQKKPQGFDA